MTPLSRSILYPAQEMAYRRHLHTLSFDTTDLSVSPDLEGDLELRRPLASLTSALWGVSPQITAWLLATAPASLSAQDKPGKAANKARDTLADLAISQNRLRAWAGRVFELSWRQAELLQIMEEIEPMVADALLDVQRLGVATVGSYAHVWALLQKRSEAAVWLDVVAGLATPDADRVTALVQGMNREEWLQRYGHRGENEWELASPRLRERPPDLSLLSPVGAWNPQRAQRAREEAVQLVIAGAGFLQRAGWRKMIELAQATLVAHAQAQDTLAYVLAAVRRWCLAAGREGAADRRLNQVEEIFLLHLEETKRMMTGEWHSREQIQEVIAERHPQRLVKSPPNGPGAATARCGRKIISSPRHPPGNPSRHRRVRIQ